MKFRENLIESEESILNKLKSNYSKSLYKSNGLRMFHRIKIDECTELSIQASSGHYCRPRETISVIKYTHMELAILKNDDFVPVSDVINDKALIKEFKGYSVGNVYAYVPVKLLEKLYRKLTNK